MSDEQLKIEVDGKAMIRMLDCISDLVEHFEIVDKAFGEMWRSLNVELDPKENEPSNVINLAQRRLDKDPNEIYNNKGDNE